MASATEKYPEKYQHAQDLVKQSPEDAACLIAAVCDYRDIVETLIRVRDRGQRNSADSKAFESELATSPVDSQQSVSPSNIQTSRARTLPPSPPTSLTGKSSSPKGRPEYVVVIADGPADDPVQEHKLAMRKGQMLHSLIREDIVRTRLWGSVTVEPIPNAPISLDCPATPNGFLLSSQKVILTWRRIGSHRTHETLFYLVPGDINVDILLGYSDSGEGFFPTEIRAPRPQPPRREPVPPAMYPPAPDPPRDRRVPSSYRPSSTLSYGSNSTTPVPLVFQEILNRDHGQAAGYNVPSGHHSPTPTQIHLSRPSSSGDSRVPRQYATGTSSPLSSIHQQSPLDEIRVEFTWDNACINVKLDLNVPGEAFFNSVEHKLQHRLEKILDRTTHTILFATEKRTEAAAKYSLSLEETDLRDDWADAVDWMKEHVKIHSPRLYAFIRHDAG